MNKWINGHFNFMDNFFWLEWNMKNFLIPNWLNDIYWSLFSDPDVAFGFLINLAVTWYPLVTGLWGWSGGQKVWAKQEKSGKKIAVWYRILET